MSDTAPTGSGDRFRRVEDAFPELVQARRSARLAAHETDPLIASCHGSVAQAHAAIALVELAALTRSHLVDLVESLAALEEPLVRIARSLDRPTHIPGSFG